MICARFGCFEVFFFFKQKTAYEMRISDWSSDVCSSDLAGAVVEAADLAELAAATKLPLAALEQTVASVRRCVEGEESDPFGRAIGRASCRERVCQYV